MASHYSIATDHDGNIIVNSVTDEKTQYDNHIFHDLGGASFLAKFTSTGELLWYKPLDDRQVHSVIIDSHNRIYVAGSGLTIDDDNNPQTPPVPYNNYLLRLQPDGAIDFIRSNYGLASFDKCGLALDSNNNVIAYGSFERGAI